MKLIYLLRHSQQVHREEDGAVRFWRMMENLQKHFPYCHHWFDCKWKKSMAGGRARRRYQNCTDETCTRFEHACALFRVSRHSH